MGETQLFLAACSRSNKELPFKNFQRSVIGGVGPADHDVIKNRGFEDPIPVWGISEGQRSGWADLEAGDIVLFYTQKRLYTHVGRLVTTAESKDFALTVWDQGDEYQLNEDPTAPRPLLLLFDEVSRIDIPAPELHELLGYKLDYLFGGSKKPSTDSLAGIVDAYGSIESYIHSHLSRGPDSSPGTVETTVASLREATASKPSLTEDTDAFSEQQQRARSAAFRTAVREAYSNQCAVCGARRETPTGIPEVEAAHIYPRSENGSHDIRNGLALCKLHHWAFDTGWLSVTDDYQLLVNNAEENVGYEEFRRLEGDRLSVPDEDSQRPHSIFLQAHRDLHGFE